MAKTPLSSFDDKAIARFNASVDRRGSDECWPWNKRVSAKGYGIFNLRDSTFRSNRVALFLVSGVMPDELQACHSCDNPTCCNPAHLRWDTCYENQQDKALRGGVAGARNGRSKLTPEDVEVIRSSGLATRVLMERFFMSKEQINKIKRGASWGIVKD